MPKPSSICGRKIAIICMQFPPEKGAAASRIAKMAAGLRAREADVQVITALPNYPTGRIFPEYRGKISCRETIDEIPVKRLWVYPSNSAMPLKRIWNMISFSVTLLLALPHLLRSRPDAIIINSPPLPSAFTAVMLAKIVRTRVIANISDIWPMTALAVGAMSPGRFYRFLEKIERQIYRRADAIMTQSEETREHVLGHCPQKRTFLYRNLDRTSDFISVYPDIDDGALRIVYAGLLGVLQGVYDICRNVDFRGLGAELHLYGDGNEKNKIREYISNNADCNIFMHEPVPKAEVPKILSNYHATLVPLINHIPGAFPSKIYMAMSASLPVLFCGSGEGAQFVEKSSIGWVTSPQNYGGLGSNIEQLKRMNQSEYQNLRRNIQELATTTYDMDRQLDQLTEFIGTT